MFLSGDLKAKSSSAPGGPAGEYSPPATVNAAGVIKLEYHYSHDIQFTASQSVAAHSELRVMEFRWLRLAPLNGPVLGREMMTTAIMMIIMTRMMTMTTTRMMKMMPH